MSLNDIRDAALSDITGGPPQPDHSPAPPGLVQALLRHMMAETVSEGIINCLIVTNSKVANVQLTRIHEHLFAREHRPTLVYSLSLCTRGPDGGMRMASADLLSGHRVVLARDGADNHERPHAHALRRPVQGR